MCWSQAVLTTVYMYGGFKEAPPQLSLPVGSFATIFAAIATTCVGAMVGMSLQSRLGLEAQVVKLGPVIGFIALFSSLSPFVDSF